MKKALFALCASSALLPPAANAQPLHSYTYVEAAYFDRSQEWNLGVGEDDNQVDGDGFQVAGSFRDESGVLLQAHYGEGEIDEAWGVSLSSVNASVDLEKIGVFLGGAQYLNDQTSFWGGFGYERESLDGCIDGIGCSDYDVDELSLGAGIRHSFNAMFEINGGARFIRFDADETEVFEKWSDNDFELSIGARLQPIKLLSIGVTYSTLLDQETDNLKADIRLQF